MMSSIVLLALICVVMLCMCGVVVHSQQVEEASVLNLPKTSSEFFASFSFNCDDQTLELNDSFNRWVLWSIHSTNKPYWHIEDKSHARVFDLLNFSRQVGLMPKLIDINKICHKGMEHLQKVNNAGISAPPKPPNEHIPTALWTSLWVSCHKKLSSKQRTASNCIDIPGMVVRSSNPSKSNNPCNKEYRMVDGAHRMCLRKYALSLLEGEITELQSLLAKTNGLDFRKDIIGQITDKENMIAKVSNAMFLEIDQETFESMLIHSDDPFRHHEEWAQTMHLSQELIDEWKLWMRRVLAFVHHDWRDHYPNDATNGIETKQNDEL
jgi:hypothetical protein